MSTDGRPVEERLLQWLENDRQALDAALSQDALPTNDELTRCVVYWKGYPVVRGAVDNADVSAVGRMKSANHLRFVHRAAVQLLMRSAEANQIESESLWKAAMLREEYADAGRLQAFGAPNDEWPDCLGSLKMKLPAVEKETIRDAEAAFMRLVTKLEIETIMASRNGDIRDKWQVNQHANKDASTQKESDVGSYPFGPLTGTKVALGYALHPKNGLTDKQYRDQLSAVDGNAIQVVNGVRGQTEVWFKLDTKLQSARKRLNDYLNREK